MARSFTKNRCPICSVVTGRSMLMCRAHWFTVPKALRDRIWGLFQRAAGSEAHRTACFEAIELVRAKVGTKAEEAN